DIVEKGTHDELIAAQGAYWRLYQSQFEQAATDLDAEAALTGSSPVVVTGDADKEATSFVIAHRLRPSATRTSSS
ncbi:hypothetical protein CTI14_55515, partial [Methylobacterium radiotolerans]